MMTLQHVHFTWKHTKIQEPCHCLAIETDIKQKIVMGIESKNDGKENSEPCHVLNCPLCQEEHQVGPNGISGFRPKWNIWLPEKF